MYNTRYAQHPPSWVRANHSEHVFWSPPSLTTNETHNSKHENPFPECTSPLVSAVDRTTLSLEELPSCLTASLTQNVAILNYHDTSKPRSSSCCISITYMCCRCNIGNDDRRAISRNPGYAKYLALCSKQPHLNRIAHSSLVSFQCPVFGTYRKQTSRITQPNI